LITEQRVRELVLDELKRHGLLIERDRMD
jgi:hypothetical protein